MSGKPIPEAVAWAFSILEAGNWREVYMGTKHMRLEVSYPYEAWERLMAALAAAQQQGQAAPPSAPVGVRNAILEALNLVHAEGRARVESATAEMADRLAALAQQPPAADEAMVERIAALLHEEATGEPWAVAGVAHPGPDRDYYRGLARKVAALAAQHQEPKS